MNNNLKNIRTPITVVEDYLDLLDKKQNAVNKKRKEIERKIQDLSERYKYIETDKELIKKKNQKQNLYYELEEKYKLVEKTIATNVEKVLILLAGILLKIR